MATFYKIQRGFCSMTAMRPAATFAQHKSCRTTAGRRHIWVEAGADISFYFRSIALVTSSAETLDVASVTYVMLRKFSVEVVASKVAESINDVILDAQNKVLADCEATHREFRHSHCQRRPQQSRLTLQWSRSESGASSPVLPLPLDQVQPLVEALSRAICKDFVFI
ncbi:hypothetical protein CAPTEDRAFT_190925 [Capitella teleta]|uniref:Uncharacterized protein n=1 Tax=Capitella teleta TaxID=283909 RepID=R7T6Y1_CAPTE|nr:hypothetical protein CAPTEDRAFT_190925 [Capitella teleta]|eukprot:ELT89364.1 hypothetical protein CAPTEDRAFT_190925 [Capitella teleta]